MAEAVRAQLEQQLDELHDLRRRGLFTKAEIGRIVKRREAFEYALRRRQTRKSDFVGYIRYEMDVDALRRRRKEVHGVQKKNRASDYSIVRRIHSLFQRALQKFKGDMKLWLQFFDFCEEQGSHKALARAFGEAIQLHPRNAGLWIKAAKWEFEDNANARAARALMQRALRLNPDDKQLWLEYFRLELLYLEKMSKRRLVLGLPLPTAPDTLPTLTSVPGSRKRKRVDRELAARKTLIRLQGADGAPQSDSDDDSDSEDGSAAGDGEGEGEGGVDVPRLNGEKGGTASTTGADPSADEDPFLRGDVPRIVFQNARQAVPGDAAFALSFVSIYRLFPNTRAGRQDVYNSLTEGEAGMDARARRPLEDFGPDEERLPLAEAIKATQAGYTEALSKFPTETMWARYVTFFAGVLRTHEAASDEAALLLGALQNACEGAQRAGMAGPAILGVLSDVRLASRDVQGAVAALEAGSRDDIGLAARWLQLVSRMQPADSAEVVLQRYQACAAHYSPEDAAGLWQQCLEQCVLRGMTADRLCAAFEPLAAQTTPALDGLRRQFVAWACQTVRPKRARRIADRLLSHPSCTSLALLRDCITFEQAQPKPSRKRITRLFEAAVDAYGADNIELWLAYVRAVDALGDATASGALYWRAVKALGNPDAFMSAFSLQGGAGPSTAA